jgi:hypothetical protein
MLCGFKPLILYIYIYIYIFDQEGYYLHDYNTNLFGLVFIKKK